MQIVSWGDNLHECQSLFSGKNKNLSSAEFDQRVVKIKTAKT